MVNVHKLQRWTDNIKQGFTNNNHSVTHKEAETLNKFANREQKKYYHAKIINAIKQKKRKIHSTKNMQNINRLNLNRINTRHNSSKKRYPLLGNS